MATLTNRRNRNKKHTSSALIVGIATVMCVVVSIASFRYEAINDEKKEHLQGVMDAIEKEEERAEEIRKYGEYVQTNQYVEEMAKKKLGLVKDGEIIFRAE